MALSVSSNTPLSRQVAADRLLSRRKARGGLLDFAKFVVKDYQTPNHIQDIAKKLEDVESGKLKRLMILEPPRHGKSMLASQLFPCWVLGRNPKTEIVQTSYSASMALEQSRKARDFFCEGAVTELFPKVRHQPARAGQMKIPVERQAAHEWGTMQKGRYYAVGVGGALTGRGADIAIIDDPVKNQEDASSERIREKTWEWYTTTLYTRLSPNGAIVIIMTRWHVDDLVGRLLEKSKKDKGDQWEVLSMPAISGKKKALWPEHWGMNKLDKIRMALGARQFQSLYQQSPTIQEGNLFNITNIQVHSDLKAFPNTQFIRFWDLASSDKQRIKDSPDFTVGTLLGVTITGLVPTVWIADVVYGQWSAPKRDKKIIVTTEKDGPYIPVVFEQVGAYKDTVTRMQMKIGKSRKVYGATVSGDKVYRAEPWEPVFESGNMHIVKAKWNKFWLDHFLHFPYGVHDDAVDSLSGGFEFLVGPRERQEKLMYDAVEEHGEVEDSRYAAI